MILKEILPYPLLQSHVTCTLYLKYHKISRQMSFYCIISGIRNFNYFAVQACSILAIYIATCTQKCCLERPGYKTISSTSFESGRGKCVCVCVRGAHLRSRVYIIIM